MQRRWPANQAFRPPLQLERFLANLAAMQERLIPYKTLRRQETEVAVQIMAAIVGGFAVQRYDPGFALFGALGAFLGATLLLVLWTRVAGPEWVTAGEQHRRSMVERAQRPVWVEALNNGASMATLVIAGALLSLAPEHYGALALIGAGGFLAGAFLGLYLAFDARRAVANAPCEQVSFAEGAGRHVTGYALGLAGALAAAAAIDNPSLAIGAMLVAFLAAKFAIDMFLAAGGVPCSEAEAPLKWYHYLAAFPVGAVWWGLPFGALAVLVALTADPNVSLFLLSWVFGGTLIVTGFVSAFATAMAVLMGLYPRRD